LCTTKVHNIYCKGKKKNDIKNKNVTQYISEFITLSIGGFSMWFWQKLKTKRERKRDDLQLVNESIATLLGSIQSLTEQYANLAKKFAEEQEKNLAYLQENINLKSEVQALRKQVDRLTQQIENLKTK
jgi:chromosome segregation ATPase